MPKTWMISVHRSYIVSFCFAGLTCDCGGVLTLLLRGGAIGSGSLTTLGSFADCSFISVLISFLLPFSYGDAIDERRFRLCHLSCSSIQICSANNLAVFSIRCLPDCENIKLASVAYCRLSEVAQYKLPNGTDDYVAGSTRS